MNIKSVEELRNMYDASYAKSYTKKDTRRIEKIAYLFDLEKNDVIADFACGNGLLLNVIYKKIKYYYGVDFSIEQIEQATKRLVSDKITNATFIASEIIDFCKEHESVFDKVFTLDFSEHIYDEQFIQIYTSIKFPMKEKGKVYMHTPDGLYFLEI